MPLLKRISWPLGKPATPPPVVALPTGVTLFVGRAAEGPVGVATRVTDRAGCDATFGPPDAAHALGWSIGHYFDNGGAVAWVVSLATDDPAALATCLSPGGPADLIDRFDLLCVPGLADAATQAALQAACAARGVFFLIDCAANATQAGLAAGPPALLTGPTAVDSALYAPWLMVDDGAGLRACPPCAFVAGLYARSDATNGVWHSPAGRDARLAGEPSPSLAIDDQHGDAMALAGFGTLRNFHGVGTVIWGVRTLSASSDPAERYVSKRRFVRFVEASIRASLARTTAGRDGDGAWSAVRSTVDDFLRGLWRRGALQGVKPEQAWVVGCDRTTMSSADLAAGRLVVLIGLATLKPAEFTMRRIVVEPPRVEPPQVAPPT